MALRTCLFAASRSLPRASARPAATTPIVRAMSSASALKDVPPPANTPSKVSGIERKRLFFSLPTPRTSTTLLTSPFLSPFTPSSQKKKNITDQDRPLPDRVIRGQGRKHRRGDRRDQSEGDEIVFSCFFFPLPSVSLSQHLYIP